MIVIGVGFKKRVGKDTCYEIIRDMFPDRQVKRIAFADPLKEEIHELFLKPFGLEKSILDDTRYKDLVRPLMQGWGSMRREFFDQNYWIKKAFDQINDDNTIYVITDVRYYNELLYLKDHNGISIRVIRDSVADLNESHVSEKELEEYLDLFDFHIENNGTIEEYVEKVQNLIYGIV